MRIQREVPDTPLAIRAGGLLLSELLFRRRPGRRDRYSAAAEHDLVHWRTTADDLIRRAHASGLSVNQIRRSTGLGRFTICRILAASGAALHISAQPLFPASEGADARRSVDRP